MLDDEHLWEMVGGRAFRAHIVVLLAFLVLLGCRVTRASPTPQRTAVASLTVAAATETPAPTDTRPPIATATITLTPTPGITLRVAVAAANFRAGPGTHYGILDVLTYDTAVTILGRTADGAWFNVVTENGRRGWLGARVVYYEDPAASQEVETVVTMPPAPPTPSPPPTWTPAPAGGV